MPAITAKLRNLHASLTMPALLIILFTTLSVYSCKKNSTPTGPDILQPGRRDYVWTVDTIRPQKTSRIMLARLWGSDRENVWSVGTGSPAQEMTWHYDGKLWRTDSVPKTYCPSAVFGFGRTDAWIGNSNNEFYRCTDGKTFKLFSTHSLPDYPHVAITEIWGPSKDEVYAIGYAENATRDKFKMILMSFNGKSWNFIKIPDIVFDPYFIRKQQKSGIVLISGIVDPIKEIGYKIFSFDGKELKEIYSANEFISLNDMNGEVYISVGRQIFKYNNGYVSLWKNFTNTVYYRRLWGRNESDFFCFAWKDGKYGIGHYNGTDFQFMYSPDPDFPLYEGLVLENEVFFLGHDSDRTGYSLIIHGKLKGD